MNEFMKEINNIIQKLIVNNGNDPEWRQSYLDSINETTLFIHDLLIQETSLIIEYRRIRDKSKTMKLRKKSILMDLQILISKINLFSRDIKLKQTIENTKSYKIRKSESKI
ncbi:hypothetical protein RF11_14202 [Thelohanellus kitauei]|uniref:Uncharacterized protein n=1 Tax=Thelohanellus kitauei TaxID=669202 RepID=A0A0C2JKM1_THEKT|nr:hypothetical protein RF11_14202 [Thelohanellus kitauei]